MIPIIRSLKPLCATLALMNLALTCTVQIPGAVQVWWKITMPMMIEFHGLNARWRLTAPLPEEADSEFVSMYCVTPGSALETACFNSF